MSIAVLLKRIYPSLAGKACNNNNMHSIGSTKGHFQGDLQKFQVVLLSGHFRHDNARCRGVHVEVELGSGVISDTRRQTCSTAGLSYLYYLFFSKIRAHLPMTSSKLH